jgi:phage tail-like protein
MGDSLPSIYVRAQPPPTTTRDAAPDRVARDVGSSPADMGFPAGVYIVEGSGERPAGPASGGPAGSGPWVISIAPETTGGGYEPLLVEFFRAGRRIATGRIAPEPAVLSITSTHCGSDAGTYRWTFDGRFLRLNAVDDPCAARLALLASGPLERRPLVLRMMDAFDEALAPVIASLDNLEAYFDPRLAPEDFVDWLCTWVAFSPRQDAPLPHRRAHVRRAVQLLRTWGTASGIRHFVAIFAGVRPEQVEIEDNGGVTSSTDPRVALPGTPQPALTVRVRLDAGDHLQPRHLDRLVSVAKPAHVPHEVEVVAG